jgi:hypothetical protein
LGVDPVMGVLMRGFHPATTGACQP